MHSAGIYGDDLTEIRNTLKIANDDKRFVEGFEEGRIFNAYRFVYPLFNNDEHIGCMEISPSFGSVSLLMDNFFSDASIFIIRKSIVDEKVWKEKIEENYGNCKLSDLYYYDKEIYSYIEDKDKFNKIILQLKNEKELDELILSEESFMINIEGNKCDCSVIFLKIDNGMDNHVGYLVLHDKNNIFVSTKESIIHTSILLGSMVLMLITLIIFMYKSRVKMIKITYFDKLTGAFNRNKLENCLVDEIEKSNRYDTTFSIIMLDFDYFKNVNDVYGHTKGDEVLKEIVRIIQNNLRINDSIFRFGGDEFIIFLSNTELADARKVAEKLRKSVSDKEKIAEVVEKVTLSMGVVEYIDDDSWLDIIGSFLFSVDLTFN